VGFVKCCVAAAEGSSPARASGESAVLYIRVVYCLLNHCLTFCDSFQPTHHRRTSGMSSLSLSRRRTIESSNNLPSTISTNGTERVSGPLWHRAAPRGEVPGLQPVTVKQISNELLAGVTFLPSMVVTISKGGTIKVFMRPEHRL
jgi:hypothetical protein